MELNERVLVDFDQNLRILSNIRFMVFLQMRKLWRTATFVGEDYAILHTNMGRTHHAR